MSLLRYKCTGCGKEVVDGLFHVPTRQCLFCLRDYLKAADQAKTKMAEDLVR